MNIIESFRRACKLLSLASHYNTKIMLVGLLRKLAESEKLERKSE
jgi:hypothetical protein